VAKAYRTKLNKNIPPISSIPFEFAEFPASAIELEFCL
jgi:hypothetical protein